jgi:hypothetical protein
VVQGRRLGRIALGGAQGRGPPLEHLHEALKVARSGEDLLDHVGGLRVLRVAFESACEQVDGALPVAEQRRGHVGRLPQPIGCGPPVAAAGRPPLEHAGQTVVVALLAIVGSQGRQGLEIVGVPP